MTQVTAELVEEIKALIDSGDLDLAQMRAKFKRVMGRETTLNDEKLIKAIAATDDDDTDLLVKNITLVEQE